MNRSFILRYCWLANTTGRAGKFLAFDMVQEHNIRDIKVSEYTFEVLLSADMSILAYLRRTRSVRILGLYQTHFRIHTCTAQGKESYRSGVQPFSTRQGPYYAEMGGRCCKLTGIVS